MSGTTVNWVDLLVVLALLVFVWHGWRRGAMAVLHELAGLVAGLLVALLAYVPAARLGSSVFGLAYPFAKPLAFLVVWIAAELTLPSLVELVIPPRSSRHQVAFADRLFGLPLSLLEGLAMSVFVLSLAVSFQLPSVVRRDILASSSGSHLIGLALPAESWGSSLTGRSEAYETLAVSVHAVGADPLVLWSSGVDSFPDTLSEDRLFELLNDLRQREGRPSLVLDQSLVVAARHHGEDVFSRGYLSSVSPEGRFPEERASQSGASFSRLHESVLHAPDAKLSLRGLLETPLSREALLSLDYGRVGLGVLNGGGRGRVFVLELVD